MTPIVLDRLETVATGFAFTEDPRWRDGKLYFSDMQGDRVCAMDGSGAVETIAELDDCPSGLGFMPNGDLLIVSMFKEKLLRRSGARLTAYADLAPLAGFGINDMAVDAKGRAYVVQFGFDYRKRAPLQPSALLAVQPDGAVGIAAQDLLIGNGIVISEDGRTLIVAESAGGRITAFDIAVDGALSNRRVFAHLPEGHHPDGICLDSAGGVWVAAIQYGVLRIEQGGRITHKVAPPTGRNAYACMLGGRDRKDLYICTAEAHEREETRAKRTSSIVRVLVEIAGCGLP